MTRYGTQVMGGYGSGLLAKFGLGEVKYNVTKFTMELNQSLLGDLPRLNSVIAHENYHVRFALVSSQPRLHQRPRPADHARVRALYRRARARTTPVARHSGKSRSGRSGSTVGAYGGELIAPPIFVGTAGLTFTTGLATIGAYQLGSWYFDAAAVRSSSAHTTAAP